MIFTTRLNPLNVSSLRNLRKGAGKLKMKPVVGLALIGLLIFVPVWNCINFWWKRLNSCMISTNLHALKTIAVLKFYIFQLNGLKTGKKNSESVWRSRTNVSIWSIMSYSVIRLRISDFLKNILGVKVFFLEELQNRYNKMSADRMPPHRNESSGSKTRTFRNLDTFLKKDHYLSRERATVMTGMSSSGELFSEFLSADLEDGVVNISPPMNMKATQFQWAPKGSCRIENMSKVSKNLKQICPPFPSQMRILMTVVVILIPL